MCSDILCFLVSSSHCSYFLIIFFSAKINNRRVGTGPDRTNAGDDRNTGQDGESNGTCYVIFCSLVYSFILLALLFPIVYSTKRVGHGGAARNGTKVGGDSNVGQDRGTGGRKRR